MTFAAEGDVPLRPGVARSPDHHLVIGNVNRIKPKKYSPADSTPYRRAVPPWAHYVWSEFGLVQSGLMSASRARVHDRFAL